MAFPLQGALRFGRAYWHHCHVCREITLHTRLRCCHCQAIITPGVHARVQTDWASNGSRKRGGLATRNAARTRRS